MLEATRGFPIITCIFLGGPSNKDYSILGSILGFSIRETSIVSPHKQLAWSEFLRGGHSGQLFQNGGGGA